MKKLSVILFCLLFYQIMFQVRLYSQTREKSVDKGDTIMKDDFTIAGEILLKDKGILHIFLVDEKTAKTPFTGIRKLEFEIKEEEIGERIFPFEFKNIKKGVYGIRCFMDKNGNGVLDKGFFGPKEPWGISWQGEKPPKWPKWKNYSFNVDTDKTDLLIRVEK